MVWVGKIACETLLWRKLTRVLTSWLCRVQYIPHENLIFADTFLCEPNVVGMVQVTLFPGCSPCTQCK